MWSKASFSFRSPIQWSWPSLGFEISPNIATPYISLKSYSDDFRCCFLKQKNLSYSFLTSEKTYDRIVDPSISEQKTTDT